LSHISTYMHGLYQSCKYNTAPAKFNLFLVMVFCNKCPLSFLTQVFFSFLVFLRVKVVPFHVDEQIT